MENLIIAAMLAAMIHSYVDNEKEQKAIKEEINWDLAGNFRTESTPNTVQWVIITDE